MWIVVCPWLLTLCRRDSQIDKWIKNKPRYLEIGIPLPGDTVWNAELRRFLRASLSIPIHGKRIFAFSGVKMLSLREPSVLRLKHPTMHLKKKKILASFNFPLFRLSNSGNGATQTAAIKAPGVLRVILGLMTGNVTLSGFLSFVHKDRDG